MFPAAIPICLLAATLIGPTISADEDVLAQLAQLQSAQRRHDSLLDSLQSQLSTQAAQLIHLGRENVALRAEVGQLRLAVANVSTTGGVESILDSIEHQLVDMKSSVKLLTSRQRPEQSGRAVRHLQLGLNSVKRDVKTIQMAEERDIPELKVSLGQQDAKIIRLLTVTEHLGEKLNDLSQADQTFVYSQTEMDRLREEIRRLNSSYAALQQKNFAMSDEQKWNEFLIETVRVDMEELRDELRSADTQLATQVNLVVDSLNESNSRSLPIRLGSDLESPVVEGSGEGPTVRPDLLYQLRKEISGATESCAKMTTFGEKLDRKVQLCLGEVESLRVAQKSFLRDLQEVQLSAAPRDSLAALSKDLQQLKTLPKAIEKVKLTQVAEAKSLRNSLAQVELMARGAEKIAAVVQKVQSDHFGLIQTFAQDANEVRTDLLRFGLKLTSLQADFLNSSLLHYRQNNADLQQDVFMRDLRLRLEQMDDHHDRVYQELKTLAGVVRNKVDLATFKEVRGELATVGQKLGDQTNFTSQLQADWVQLSSAVVRLESQLPADCSSVSGLSGVYLLKPIGSGRSVAIFCQIEPDGTRWAVVQSRIGPEENFNRSWAEYAEGFGDPSGSHWLGNEFLHLMTSRQPHQLQVELVDIFDRFWVAKYSRFAVGPRSNGFPLAIGGPSGNVSDPLAYHNHMRFSAVDKDEDASSTNCARYYASGWWFSHCLKTNLNGNFNVGMIWFNSDSRDWIQLRRVTMKIRPDPTRPAPDQHSPAGGNVSATD